MIKHIAVFNRFHMDLVANKMRGIPSENWDLISISCCDTEDNIRSLINDRTRESLISQGCNKILPLQFDDLRDDQIEMCRKQGYEPMLFTKNQAKQVVEFINEVHKESKDSDLIIHCDAGISRSGAVARFTSEHLGIPFRDPNILPNRFVLRLLWEEADAKKAKDLEFIDVIRG